MTSNKLTHLLPTTARPAGSGATLNPFVVVEGAAGFIDFVVEVLGGVEVVEARTPLPDGRLVHAEIALGDARACSRYGLTMWPQPR